MVICRDRGTYSTARTKVPLRLLVFVLATAHLPASSVSAADCNNGFDDAEDITAGRSLDCNAHGLPDRCETEGANGSSPDCNANGAPDKCEPAGVECLLTECGDVGTADCCVANGSPNCDGAACCNAICGIDAFCCETDWDAGCAGLATQICSGPAPASPDTCDDPCGDPNSGACCVVNGTSGCDDSACCALVCGLDPFCCGVEWDGTCAEAAGTLCTDSLSAGCERCEVACPAGSPLEGEPVCFDEYLDSTNGGCNSNPAVFTPIACGGTICGEGGNFVFGGLTARDTDWFEITIDEPTSLTLTVTADFPVSAGFLKYEAGFDGSGSCENITGTITPAVVGEPCEEVSVTRFCPNPGTYFLFVSTEEFVGVTCGSEYTAELSCQPRASPGECRDGNLDPAFDFDGLVRTDFGGSDAADALVLQTDGKIVVVGASTAGADSDFALARYNADGSLDTSFGTDGRVTTDFDGSDHAFAVALQADGKIVAAGSRIGTPFEFDVALARYNIDGSLDTSFDTDGRVTTDFGGDDQACAVAVQTDGKIVVAGVILHGANSAFAVARYNPDGSLDTTFGTDGLVETVFGGNVNFVFDMVLLPDGKIVVSGTSDPFGTLDFALARYNVNGTLDVDFGTDGLVTTNLVGDDEAKAVALRADGRIVAAGRTHPVGFPSASDFALVQYNVDGSLDTNFGIGGRVETTFGANDVGFALALQADGKVVVGGHSDSGTVLRSFALARYNADGSLDTNFGTDGRVITDFGGDDLAFDLVVQADGGIVAAGRTDVGGTSDFALVRYVSCSVPGECLDNPADLNGDGDIEPGEMSGYGTCFLRACTDWAGGGPLPPPPGYVSRAGTLFLRGGFNQVDYCCDPSLTPPLQWVDPSECTVAPAVASQEAIVLPGADVAIREVRQRDSFVDVRIRIRPSIHSRAYAIEEKVPPGLTTSDISHAGVYHANLGSIRWGLFLDNEPRDLTYRLISRDGRVPVNALEGVVSFDGHDLRINDAIEKPTMRGDADRDGDVDLSDALQMAECFSAPSEPASLGCDVFDLDGDRDVDLADLVAFQALFTGAR